MFLPGRLMDEQNTKHSNEREIDQQIIDRVRNGDKVAFSLLVTKYQYRLIRSLSRLIQDPFEIEDVAQETFMKAYRALSTFRGESAFYSWLYRIGVNTAKSRLVDSRKKGRNIPTFSVEDAENYDNVKQLQDNTTPEGELMSKEMAILVSKTVDNLPDDLRFALVLREIEGLSYEEIASIMNCPIGTVRSRIFRARETIADEIKPLLK